MRLEQVSSSVWAITDGSTFGNVGCIRLPEGIVVIDTGMAPPLAQQFRRLIHEQVGSPVTDVILTHYHSDHIFGAQTFKDCNIIGSSALATLYAERMQDAWSPKGLKELIEFYRKNRPELADQLVDLQIVPPTQTFEHSLAIGKNGAIQIQHTGGHTIGHSIVYFAPERVLFAADLLFCQQYPYAGDETNDPQRWMQVFETILTQPIEVIVPGHGPLCTKDEIQTHLEYFQKLEVWIKDQLAQHRSLEEVLQASTSAPQLPYDEGAEHRLPATLTRWFNFYSGQQ